MNKIIKIREKAGNALLIAILIMSVLLVFGLGINRLIIKEFQVERAMLQGGQAYYSAEGASELGLYDIKTNLAGYEVEDQTGEVESTAGYDYSISALGDYWPCDMYGGQVVEDDDDQMWRVLAPEESVMVPLFSGTDKLSNFKIEYYTEIVSSDQSLRWKILGINENSGMTEAISNYEDDVYGGSLEASSVSAYYYKDYGREWGGRIYWMTMEDISTFLDGHDYPYLILTNVSEDQSYDDMYVKLSDGEDLSGDAMQIVCEYVKVEADGLMADYIQQIDAYIKRGEPLPVFDFVLWEKEL